MAENFTFPQSGDRNDAEHFGSFFGQDNLTEYVENGLNLSVDYTIPETVVSTGKAYISVATDTAASSGDTMLDVNRVVQLSQQTVSLTDDAVNYIYVDPNFNTDDSPFISVFTSQQTGDLLLIAEVDTSSNSKSEVNRAPNVQVDSLDVTSGDITDGTNVVYDQSNNWIPQARLENDSVTLSGNNVSLGGSISIDEPAQDAVGTIMSGGTDITVTYDDTANTITVDHDDTSTQGNVTTNGATVIDDIDLDGRGHVSNLNTENRSLDQWDNPVANIDMNGSAIVDGTRAYVGVDDDLRLTGLITENASL